MRSDVIVVGAGRVGTRLAALLAAEGGLPVRVVELGRDRHRALGEELPEADLVWGSGTDPETLEAAGARRARVVAAVTGSDEVNLVVCGLARSAFGVPRTIARVNNPANGWLFTETMGVDEALDQADLMAHLIVEEMSLSRLLTLAALGKGEYSLVEETLPAGSPALGRLPAALELERSVVAGVIREGQLLPVPDLTLRQGDRVLAVVHVSERDRLGRLLGG